MPDQPAPLHVSLVVTPEAMLGSLTGMYDALGCFEALATIDRAVAPAGPFSPVLVASGRAVGGPAAALPLAAQRTIHDVDRTDIVIIPSLMVRDAQWVPGRHGELVRWLQRMVAQGAVLCSACSGVLVLAETGLLDGREATIHWAYGRTFRHNFPKVALRLDRVLVVAGARDEFVMSGASASWHDLLLYLISRFVGPTAAQAVARFLLLQRHEDGQAPYVMFDAPTDHGDALVRGVQEWLSREFAVPNPVDAMVRMAGIPARSFARRFRQATGCTPIAYVQLLRVEEAKRRLERTDAPVDRVAWAVGYEDAAAFRRVFRRVTRMTPGAYRRKFRVPPTTGTALSASS